MAATPQNWNIVVVGSWNPAILTPEGVAKRIFALEVGTPIDVQIAIDLPFTVQVRHGGVLAAPSSRQLVITVEDPPTTPVMRYAVESMQRAVRSLPETPFTAVGVNIRYMLDTVPEPIAEASESSLDDLLADAAYRIQAKLMRRTLEWNGGALNLELRDDIDGTGHITFNFHKNATTPAAICEWLDRVDEILTTSQTLLALLNPPAAPPIAANA